MNTTEPTPKFLELANSKSSALEDVFRLGESPERHEFVGWEFAGWNVSRLTGLIGRRKFGKGFFQTDDGVWGYNIKAHQAPLESGWSFPEDALGHNYRELFFGVEEPGSHNDSKHPDTVLLDYRKWRDTTLFLDDYLVLPFPSTDRDVLLGRAFLADLPPSWFVLQRLQKNGNPRYEAGGSFTPGQERVLHAFIEAWYAKGAKMRVDEMVANLDRQFTGVDEDELDEVHKGLFFLEHLKGRSWFRSFSKRKVNKRIRVLDDLQNATSELDQRLAGLRTLAKVSYFQDDRAHKDITFTPPDKRCPPIPQKGTKLNLEPTPTDDDGETVEADVCVIGSGAGGAVAAYELATRDYNVILVEAGPYVPPDEVSHVEDEMVARLYRSGGVQTTKAGSMAILQGHCLGGSTFVNNCICFRLRGLEPPPTPIPDHKPKPVSHPNGPDVLAEWKKLTGAVVERKRLEKAYAAVEEFLGLVTLWPPASLPPHFPPPLDAVPGGPNADVLYSAWQRLVSELPNQDPLRRAPAEYFTKNYMTGWETKCESCGYCNTACHYGRKNSMVESYIARGLTDCVTPRFRVFQECNVDRITHRNGVAAKAKCKVGPRDGSSKRKRLTIHADAFVVSAGVIASSELLRRSRIGGKRVGRRVSFNAGTSMFALHDTTINAWKGVQMGSYVDLGNCLIESWFQPPMALAAGLSGWRTEHSDRMRLYNSLSGAGVLIPTSPDNEGRVKGGRIDFALEKRELEVLKEGLYTLGRVQFAAEACEVYPPTVAGRAVKSLRALEGVLESLTSHRDLTLSSAHPQGGNVMSASPEDGVVDSELRVHDFRNVYVCDASVFPSAIGVNPQLTIMALAQSFASRFAS